MKSKHIYSLVILSIIALFCSSCENNPVRNSIAGGTFYGEDSSGEAQIYFAKNGTCHIIAYSTETHQTLNSNNFTYKVENNVINICYDKSSFWVESVRGKIYISLIYESSGDYLLFGTTKLYRK